MSDFERIQRCLNKDKAAWDEFVEAYSRLIYSAIHGVLKTSGSRPADLERADEIFQSVFLALIQEDFRKLRSYTGKNGCSLASWLRQVAINCAIDYLRRNKAGISLDDEDDDKDALKHVLRDKALAISDEAAARERLLHLQDCIQDLDLEDKYFLELHVNHDIGLQDLAAGLKVNRGALDMRKSRIIRKLKECFRRKGFLLDF